MSTGSFSTWMTDRSLSEPSETPGQLEPGEYVAMIVEAPIEDAKSGNGIVCKLTLSVLEGPSKGQRIWANLNIKHNNPVAEKIGREQLSDLARALGMTSLPEHSAEIINRPLKIKVGKQKKDPERTEVKKFLAISGPSEPTTQTTNAKAPWGKK